MSCFWIALAAKIPTFRGMAPQAIAKRLQSLNCLTDDVTCTNSRMTDQNTTDAETRRFAALIDEIAWQVPGTFQERVEFLRPREREHLADVVAWHDELWSRPQRLAKVCEIQQLTNNADARTGEMTEKQKQENYEHIQSYDLALCSQFTEVSSECPWLLLVCQLYRVSIDFNYACGPKASGHGYAQELGALQYRHRQGHSSKAHFHGSASHFS
jgi:hypothetical protein